jgi:drug/metabolite transporter (DMT)-like permease
VCSLIWGTTWIVIKFQIDTTTAINSVFYRFLFAAILMFLFNFFVTKKNLKYPLKNHIYFALLGFFNFSLNYILTYTAEEKINSGLVAITFTSLIYFNMVGLTIWFKRPVSKNVFLGGVLGAIGITLLFFKELSEWRTQGPILSGVLIGILATFFASTGNMFSFKNHQLKIPVVVFNSYGMLYGALLTLFIGICNGETFHFPTQTSFIFSLMYLVVFGTVIAFWAYQTLIGTMGADRAGYSSIISPMIAVVISSIFENVKFTLFIILGIIFCLLGNVISLKKSKTNIIK